MAKYLVQDPATVQFLDMAALDTGAKVVLGDPEQADPIVKPDVLSAHLELHHAVGKLPALVNDPTRNDVEKHIAAKKLADALVEKLSKTKTVLAKRADQLLSDSLAAADRELGPKTDRAALHSEIRSWLREQARQQGGLKVIKEALAESEDLAAVIHHSPRYLTGLPKDTHESLRMEALRAHRPALAASIDAGVALGKMAEKFGNVITRVPRAFYNHEMAKQAARRVEV